MSANENSALSRQLTEAAAKLEELEGTAYEQGYDEGYKIGFRDGHYDALDALRTHMIKNDSDFEPQPQPELDPQSEPETLDTFPPNSGSPRLTKLRQRAVDYVRSHPGTTAAASEDAVGRGTLYRVAQKGLIRKEGSKFYPLDAG